MRGSLPMPGGRVRCRRRGFRQQASSVHEADARRQHGVGGVFGELGAAQIHDQQLSWLRWKGRVEPSSGRSPGRPRRRRRCGRGRMKSSTAAFLEELGVGDDAEKGMFVTAGVEFLRARPPSPCRRCPPARCSCRRSPCSRSCAGRCCGPPTARTAGRRSRPRRAACRRR